MDIWTTRTRNFSIQRYHLVELAIEKGTGLAAEKRVLAIEKGTTWDAGMLNWVELT
jgi:hypothetical protein